LQQRDQQIATHSRVDRSTLVRPYELVQVCILLESDDGTRSVSGQNGRGFDDFRAKYRAAVDRGIEQRTLLAEDATGLMNLADRWRPLFE
jgi:hypothetical protein